MNYYMPVRVITGDRIVEKKAELFSSYGSRCTIITGKYSAVKSGALHDVTEALRSCGISFQIFDGISQNPSVYSCQQAGSYANDFGSDFLVGIGGGSALDAAKAAAVFAANPQLEEVGFYNKNWVKDPLPILLVGTTSGTGSEVTKVSVLTDSNGKKHSIHDDRIFASISFGDARYTDSLPLPVTLSTGIDVLSHCAESYFNRKADEISRAFSIRGIRLLYEPLLSAAKGDALSLTQREQLYDASLLGGLAICGTGTCFPHNVGYYLTENYRIPHGFASAMFFPALLSLVKEKASTVSDRFFCELDLSEENILHLIEVCLPNKQIVMTKEEILAVLPRWENNNSVLNTCCEVKTSEIRSILEQMFLPSAV